VAASRVVRDRASDQGGRLWVISEWQPERLHQYARHREKNMTARVVAGLVLVGWVTLAAGSAAQNGGGEDGTATPGALALCPASFGCRFNLEASTNAVPQEGTSVDFLRAIAPGGSDLVVGAGVDGRGFPDTSGIGTFSWYYVSRDADGVPEFEGPLPDLADLNAANSVYRNHGMRSATPPAVFVDGPAVAADSVHNALFIADARIATNSAFVAIGLVRATAGRLLSAAFCPNGKHSAAQAAVCWSTRRVVQEVNGGKVRSPHLVVDERTSGVGAGDVYVTSIEGANLVSGGDVRVIACTNNLQQCSNSKMLTGGGDPAQYPYVAVRPDGRVTVTWVEQLPTGIGYSIWYASCQPAGAPNQPICPPGVMVASDARAVRMLFTGPLALSSGPVHAHRQDAGAIETYVVWERCKVFTQTPLCPDADLVMRGSNNNGGTWSPILCVACGVQDQFRPVIKTDRSRNVVNIAYYGSQGDPTFQGRYQIFLTHIALGGTSAIDPVTDTHTLTTLPNQPWSGTGVAPRNLFYSGGITTYAGGLVNDDFLIVPTFNSRPGLAARGTGAVGQSRAYVHFSYHNIQGVYGGVQAPDQNNHLSRLNY
jgi:hypothetical protein